MKTWIVVMLLLLTMPLAVSGQEPEAERHGTGWSVGTSVTYPIVRIYQLHIGRAPTDRHEVTFGPAYQNFTSGSITSHAYTLVLGYRYYLWRGLHVESEWWPAYDPIHSSLTDRRYPGVELWTELKVGSKLPMYRGRFIQPSPGVGFGIFRTNPPPEFWEDIISPIFTPQLIVGVQF
jgi:hypothetical protein